LTARSLFFARTIFFLLWGALAFFSDFRAATTFGVRAVTFALAA
jgi:hypothetical protein